MPKEKTVEIDLGGKVRKMRWDLNALAAMSDAGLEPQQLHEKLSSGRATMSVIRTMIWAFLATDAADREESGEEKALTQSRVGSWIDLENLTECTAAVMKVVLGKGQKPADAENPTIAEASLSAA